MMILCVMLGGAGTRWGPVLGATVYVMLAEVFRTIPVIKEQHVLVFSLIVCAIIMFLPDGVIPEWDKVKRAFKGQRAGARHKAPALADIQLTAKTENTIRGAEAEP
jgi:branched-chain amino acid transport system permease protein